MDKKDKKVTILQHKQRVEEAILNRNEKELLRSICATDFCMRKAKNPEFKNLWRYNRDYIRHNLEQLLPKNTSIYIEVFNGVVSIGYTTEVKHNGYIHNLFNRN